ncbi:trigger factor [Patescibacteria group bacterium]|nr:trigger factor [Patescibacteria group bacterium]MBU1922113.1 trigger factor [Patescibacteria group bacterium]
MSYTIEKLPKGVTQINFEIPPAEVEPFLQTAAQELSKQTTIHGFRPGHVPYEMVKQKFGETAIWEKALESVVRKNFVHVVAKENLETIGSPEINVEKLAPGNPLVFVMKVASVPQITKMADYKTKKLERKKVEINQEKVDKTIQDLSKMQTKEKIVERAATKADKIVVDMDIERDNVAIEGGASKDFQVYLSEENYIPGLCDQLIGLKKDDEKKFALEFPKEHYQKNLAGKKADFKIKAKQVYELEPPQINNEFAKSLGQDSLEKLKSLIHVNLEQEDQLKEEAKLEHKLFEQIIGDSKFSDIPDLLVNDEINKMINELKFNVEKQGMKFDDYLKQIKKDLGQLKIDMAAEAMRRIKAALLIQEIATRENVQVAEKELDEEQDRQAGQFKENDEQRKKIYSPEYRDYLKTVLRNRKAIQLLKENMIK